MTVLWIFNALLVVIGLFVAVRAAVKSFKTPEEAWKRESAPEEDGNADMTGLHPFSSFRDGCAGHIDE